MPVPRFVFGASNLLLAEAFVEMVRVEVPALAPGVTDEEVKLHAAWAGKLAHDKATA